MRYVEDEYTNYLDDLDDRLSMRPKCSCCDEHIQTEKYLEIGGEIYCWDCVADNSHFSDYLDD